MPASEHPIKQIQITAKEIWAICVLLPIATKTVRSGRISESISDKADKRDLEAGKHCEFNPTGFCVAVVNINLTPLAFKWCTSHEVLKSNSEEQRSGFRCVWWTSWNLAWELQMAPDAVSGNRDRTRCGCDSCVVSCQWSAVGDSSEWGVGRKMMDAVLVDGYSVVKRKGTQQKAT